jgi:hypothetical protein
MRLLVKFPTRARPEKFLKLLRLYLDYLDSREDARIAVTCDVDDTSMSDSIIEQATSLDPSVVLCIPGESKNKIHACNRDIDYLSSIFTWDILVLASDDMLPVYKGYDTRLKAEMEKHYPDLDGVLWFNDGYIKQTLNTMSILGRKYYERFNYIYHPSYISLWCDNEFQEVATNLGRQTYFDDVLFKHDHPCNTGSKGDELLQKNESFFQADKKTYLKRKARGFKQ